MLPVVTIPEGRLGRDPELRFAPSGVAVGKFSIASSSRKQNENNEWVDDKILWMEVICFKQLAENCAESLRKGDLVSVTGRLQTDEWEDESGGKRSRTVLIADGVAVNLRFRTIGHGQGQAERTSAPPDVDRWASSGTTTAVQPDEPPF
jgi:single-strand DNA-binding protein